MAPIIDDTFAEAFPMVATRLVITAADQELAEIAANGMCGNASSVIGCDLEAAIDTRLAPEETPDGRPGVVVLAFAFKRSQLEKSVARRLGQNVLTCPTTACYAGMDADADQSIQLGAQLRYFGDGHQISKKLNNRRIWRVPVMDGEFLIEHHTGSQSAIGGGNLILTAESESAGLGAARKAVRAMLQIPDTILPFPSGIVRSGSKVGSKYPLLKASTNDAWCPLLRGTVDSSLQPRENCVYEIVIDGLTEDAIKAAMSSGIATLKNDASVLRITAGNYGGKLGPHHFHLRELLDSH